MGKGAEFWFNPQSEKRVIKNDLGVIFFADHEIDPDNPVSNVYHRIPFQHGPTTWKSVKEFINDSFGDKGDLFILAMRIVFENRIDLFIKIFGSTENERNLAIVYQSKDNELGNGENGGGKNLFGTQLKTLGLDEQLLIRARRAQKNQGNEEKKQDAVRSLLSKEGNSAAAAEHLNFQDWYESESSQVAKFVSEQAEAAPARVVAQVPQTKAVLTALGKVAQNQEIEISKLLRTKIIPAVTTDQDFIYFDFGNNSNDFMTALTNLGQEKCGGVPLYLSNYRQMTALKVKKSDWEAYKQKLNAPGQKASVAAGKSASVDPDIRDPLLSDQKDTASSFWCCLRPR